MHLSGLKDELVVRWPMTSLLDILKETDLRVGITRHFASLTSHEALDAETLQRRLLLCRYGLGTNADDLTPLVYAHVNYGTFSLNRAERLELDPDEVAA